MSRKRWNGLLASAFIALVAVAVDGCSGGDSSSAVSDGGTEASHIPPKRLDSGFEPGSDGGGDASVPAFDGTSGKPCTSDASCLGAGDAGAGVNVCSNKYNGSLGTLNGVTAPQFWPTPVCMVPLPTMAGVGNCDPGPSGTQRFCDGPDPRDSSSAGICIPITTPQQAGPTNGVCLPHCTFAPDGSPATGCPGKDSCVPLQFLLNLASGVVTGHGFCQGGCQADADCTALGAGWVCQTDIGFCTKTKKVRTKAIGSLCTTSGSGPTPLATSDSETGACNCPGTASAFYCASACVVGGVPCPSGYVCDAQQPSGPLVFPGAGQDGGDFVAPALPTQNPGLVGLCLASCGANQDAGGTPTGSADTGPAESGIAESGVRGEAGAIEAGTPADAGAAAPGTSVCPGASNVPPLSTCTTPADTNGTLAGPDCLP